MGAVGAACPDGKAGRQAAQNTSGVSPALLDDFSRIHDPARIERVLDRDHGVDRRLTVFSLEETLLALADAMLPGAGSIHGESPLD